MFSLLQVAGRKTPRNLWCVLSLMNRWLLRRPPPQLKRFFPFRRIKNKKGFCAETVCFIFFYQRRFFSNFIKDYISLIKLMNAARRRQEKTNASSSSGFSFFLENLSFPLQRLRWWSLTATFSGTFCISLALLLFNVVVNMLFLVLSFFFLYVSYVSTPGGRGRNIFVVLRIGWETSAFVQKPVKDWKETRRKSWQSFQNPNPSDGYSVFGVFNSHVSGSHHPKWEAGWNESWAGSGSSTKTSKCHQLATEVTGCSQAFFRLSSL